MNSALEVEHAEHQSNKYASHKSISQGLLSVAVLQQLLSILIWIWTNNISTNVLEIILTVFIGLTLMTQIIVYHILWILLAASTIKQKYFYGIKSTHLNLIVTYLSGIELILSVIITVIYTQLLTETK